MEVGLLKKISNKTFGKWEGVGWSFQGDLESRCTILNGRVLLLSGEFCDFLNI